jgi:hypothetical protein
MLQSTSENPHLAGDLAFLTSEATGGKENDRIFDFSAEAEEQK